MIWRIEEALEGFAYRLHAFHVDTKCRTSEQRGQPAGKQGTSILAGKRLGDSRIQFTGRGRVQPTLRTAEKMGSEHPYGFITSRAEVVARYTS